VCKINFDPPPNLIFLGRKRGSEHLRDSDVRGGRRAGRQRVRRWGRALGLSSGPAFRGTTLGASAVGDSTPTDHPDPYERGGGSRPGNVFRQSHVSIRKIVSSQTPPLLPHLTYPCMAPPASPALEQPTGTTSSVYPQGRTQGGVRWNMIPPSPPTPDLPLPSPKVYSHLAYPRPPFSALLQRPARWSRPLEPPPARASRASPTVAHCSPL
jgi:hypothetical protein